MDEFTDEWLETTLRSALELEPAPSVEALDFALGLALEHGGFEKKAAAVEALWPMHMKTGSMRMLP